ncbi:MAG: IS4/IS5 family transposase, partial [Flavobacteriales bacterium]
MAIVARLIFNLLPNKGSVFLLMDRINWKLGKSNVNILMLAVSYKNASFPLVFKMLDKRGNSSSAERNEAIGIPPFSFIFPK